MTKTDIDIATLKLGHKQMVDDITEVKNDIKEIKAMLISNLVTIKDFSEYKFAIRTEIEAIKKDNDEKMKNYQRSQLWQKVMSTLGGFGIAIISMVLAYEVMKVIK